ncbi:bifunctional 2-polyprenyl-6-hydroxyphenol methylase/3-demethylubiquinol 3-O-methyltransferase UbiG [Phenylobacterium sp.]|uniref:class I SAM-dependent methyltransferase n=1 Tax=Phenylobacterium sp. TaxID=1871053 RepID=UPI002721EB6A|nr:class I SAM-dependent methyltransferase [Phenylobacterium sp.]MDO8801741.1 class I SAM-dependent methyltransferase [Phenylobacterium sp.]
MTDKTAPLAPDDLPGLAQAAWRHGARHCVACGGYHRVWGTLRAAGLNGGLASDGPDLEPRIAAALAPGAKVLVAGAADPALLDLVVRTAAGIPLEITVADVCRTPLEVIGELRPYARMSVRTEQIDLTRLDRAGRWDLILSHLMIAHVPPGDRIEVLTRLRRALTPKGRLILVARTISGAAREDAPGDEDAWVNRTQAQLAASGLPGLGAPGEFEGLLRSYAAHRTERLWDLATPQAIADLLAAGGFEVDGFARMARAGRDPARADDKARYVFVAH